VDVGNRIDWTLSGLDRYQRYYFVVQAYNAARLLSDPTPVVDNGGLVTQGVGTLRDDRPSLYWHHSETGELRTWHLSGTNVVDSRTLSIPAVADTRWKVAGTGDLNGDGFTDVVWRNDDGTVAAWLLRNTIVIQTSNLSIPTVADRGWRLAGVGDTDGDGRADLVWQHTNGSLGMWFMRGAQVVGTKFLSIAKVSDTAWQIAEVADINKDGRADLLWRHNDGWLGAWLLNGATVKETSLLSVPRISDPAWRLVAAGRLDSLSPPALVWQHVTGGIGVWYLNRYTVTGTFYLNPQLVADTKWNVVGAR
jgi:hypothetical protein